MLYTLPAHAYEMRLQFAHEPDKIYAHTCAEEETTCAAYFNAPFVCDDPSPDKKFCRGTIETGVIVEDGTMSIRFLYEGRRISGSAQGWNFFDEEIKNIRQKPLHAELYLPNPLIRDDPVQPKLLVARPPNAFLTSVIVSVK